MLKRTVVGLSMILAAVFSLPQSYVLAQSNQGSQGSETVPVELPKKELPDSKGVVTRPDGSMDIDASLEKEKELKEKASKGAGCKPDDKDCSDRPF